MGITSFVGLSHPNILRMKNLPFQACLFYYSLFCSNKFGKRSNKKTKAFTLVFLLLYSRWELPFGESCSNILRLKNHPFQVCLFSSSCFYSNEFEKALETKNPKQLLWVFQSSVLETGLEPVRTNVHWILSPTCLPIPPLELHCLRQNVDITERKTAPTLRGYPRPKTIKRSKIYLFCATRAKNGIRTRDPHLGKVVLYH